MADFQIITDSSCDLTQQMADELELSVVPLLINADGKEYKNYLDGREIEFSNYYAMLRSGVPAKTSAPNVEAFEDAMRESLSLGKDVLYIAFDSALSATYSAGSVAAENMKKEFPDRKIYVVDTLAASMGEGLLIYYAVQYKRTGKTIEEVRDYCESIKMHICHLFTVDDLHFLQRGGRVSKTTAIVGSAIGIKPLMHTDNEGHLTKTGIARGRKNSLKSLKDRMGELISDPKREIAFISHGDCIEDAQYLASLIKEELGIKEVVINYVGPVIGTHSGPGTIALFFMATER